MPKHKAIRNRTNSVRKKPLRDAQEQYRHTHGLTTLDLSMRQCFQMQMVSASTSTQTLSSCDKANFLPLKNGAMILKIVD